MDVYGLLGNPVGHSVSPLMQEAGFNALGLDAKYVTFEPPVDTIEQAVAAAETLGIKGLNVTIPFKESVVPLVETDQLAARVGAVNTIDFSTSPPTGYNTDVSGAMRAITHHGVDLTDRRVVLIGAGGAARAIAVGLLDAGANVTVVNRTRQRAEALASEFPDLSVEGFDSLSTTVAESSVLINATSVGMESNETVVPAAALHEDLVVMDIVYRPLQTRLLREAASAGAVTIDGAWMLLFQGTAAFERWTGKEAPVEAMNEALRAALETGTT